MVAGSVHRVRGNEGRGLGLLQGSHGITREGLEPQKLSRNALSTPTFHTSASNVSTPASQAPRTNHSTDGTPGCQACPFQCCDSPFSCSPACATSQSERLFYRSWAQRFRHASRAAFRAGTWCVGPAPPSHRPAAAAGMATSRPARGLITGALLRRLHVFTQWRLC